MVVPVPVHKAEAVAVAVPPKEAALTMVGVDEVALNPEQPNV